VLVYFGYPRALAARRSAIACAVCLGMCQVPQGRGSSNNNIAEPGKWTPSSTFTAEMWASAGLGSRTGN
jgi:hypothetical protein